jgi:hypothetical protein
VTHNGSLAGRADRVLELEDARLTELRRGPGMADGVPDMAVESSARSVSSPDHSLLQTHSSPRDPFRGER